MKKTVGVLSLLVMLLSQVFSPFAYAVSGDETSIEELVVVEVVEEPVVVETETNEGTIDLENPVGGEIVIENKEGDENNSGVVEELPEVQPEISSGDKESITGGIDMLSGGIDMLSGEQENLKEEVENLSGTEVSSGFFETITEGIKNLLGIGNDENGEISEEAFESKEIYGTGEYEGVKVEVYAATGLFVSGTILTIEPVIEEQLDQVKEVLLSGEVDLLEEQVIAFDITFRDPVTQEELQPRNGTVQVKFNYEENESLVQAEQKEEQEVKVYHLNDIDEEGNKIEGLTGTKVEEVVVNGEESEEENVMVVEAKSFSIYAIIKGDSSSSIITVKYMANGGIFKNNSEELVVSYELKNNGNFLPNINVQAPNRESGDISIQSGWMFDGWYLTPENQIDEWSGRINNPDDEIIVYARWLPFNDYTFVMSGITYTIMDRNLGSENIADGTYYVNHYPDQKCENLNKLGKYYQWGNNYGFSNTGIIANSGSESFDASSYGKLNYYSSPIYIDKSGGWDSSENGELWGYPENTSESKQGPCPNGYYIPTKKEWTDLYNSYLVWKSTDEGESFCNGVGTDAECIAKKLRLPYAGYRYSSQIIYNQGSYAYYWSSTRGSYGPDILYFTSAGTPIVTADSMMNLQAAVSVRCFKNSDKKADLLKGEVVNKKMNYLSAGANYQATYWNPNTVVKKFLRSDSLPTTLSVDNIISTEDSDYPVYIWFDDGNIYYYSEADKIYLNKSASAMFHSFRYLDKVETKNWDTSKVKSMSSMFYTNERLTEIDVSKRDTSNVTSMGSMFDDCRSLTELDVSKWDTSNVTDMSDLFDGCRSLTKLDVSKWNTSNVTNMGRMFVECRSLINLDISKWNTSKVKNMSYMFSNCSLTELNVSKRDTSNVTDMSYLFDRCKSLTELDVSKRNTSNVTNMNSMFNGCNNLTNLDVSKRDTSNVTDMSYLFDRCKSLTELDVSKRNTSNVTNMNSMFNGCNNLTNLDVSKRDTSNVTNMNSMFNGCNNLTNLDVSKRDTSNVSSMNSMFNGCNNLLNLDVSIWNTRGVVDMGKIFRDCKSITKLDLSNWNTSNVTNMDGMFEGLGNLGTIYASKNFRTINVSSSSTLFYGDTLLTGGNGTAYDSDKISIEYAKIDKPGQQGYFTQSGSNNEQVAYLLPGKTFNTYLRSIANNGTTGSITSFSEDNVSITGFLKASNLKDGVETKISTYDSDVPIYAWFETGIIYYYTTADIIELDRDSSYMFSNMKNLKNVEIENFKTSVLRDMNTMFKGCQSIENLDLSGWSTNYVVNMNNIFEGCSGLVNLNLSNWNVNKVGSESYDGRFKSMFKGCSSLNNLILDGWNLSGLPNDSNLLQYMLEGCPITRISMRGWILPKYFEYVAGYMLRNTSVVEIDVSNRDLGITESLHDAFWNASVNRIIGINTWTGTNIVLKDISNLFESACNIEEIDMSDMDFSKVTKASSLFSYYYGTCNGYNQLKRVNLRNVKLNSVEDMSYLLKDQHFLEEVDMRNMDLSNLKNIKGMFQNDSQLKVLKMSNITFGSLENIQYFCQSCSNLEEVDLSNWNINITEYNDNNSDSLFMSASHLKDVKMPNFGKIPSTYGMFEFNNDLTGLDLVGLDTSETINMDYMFGYSQKLETIYVTDKFNTGKVETSIDMFDGAVSLVGGNGTKYDPNNVDVTYARIDNEYQPGYFTDPRHFAVKYLTTTGFELEKKWISTGSTVDKLEDSHRNYRYYTSGDLKTGFDFTKSLYGYTEIYVTWDDVHYLTYEYGTGVEEGTIYSGSCIEENGEDRIERKIGCEVILPELNVLTGYHTPLWYKKGEDITYPNLVIVLTGDEVLEAKAIPNNYAIVYKPGTGTGEMESQDFEYDKEENLNKNKYTKNGYHFSGWIDALGKEYRDGEKVLNLLTEGILELTAQWLQNPPAAGGGKSIAPAKEQEHNVAEEQKQEEKETIDTTEKEIVVEQVPSTTDNSSTQTTTQSSTQRELTGEEKEIQTAYEWAYEHNVTTIPSLEDANPDGPVTRGHLAKMVVNYATNVLGREIPEKIPSECRWNDWRKDWESEEIKDYAVKSCALGLMGLDMPKFLPNMQVTRAQFGTIMSRLLWGKRYAGGTPYYRKHLNALKENGIMTQIDNPEKRVELRQWVWLMLMRSVQNK